MATSMLGISARMQAGKTTVSTAVASTMVAKRISFGSAVKAEAKKRGDEGTREALQDLGESLVQEDVRGFCERVLVSQGWKRGESIVVDGVRHVKVLKTLREIVDPKYFGLIYLNIDRATQLKRWKDEDIPYTKSLEELERHPTEIEVVTKLPDYADLVLDGARLVDNLVQDVIRWSKSNSLIPSWDERNVRRIELAKKKVRGTLNDQEREEFDLLQSSFMQYLEAKHNPFRIEEVDQQLKLEALRAELLGPRAVELSED